MTHVAGRYRGWKQPAVPTECTSATYSFIGGVPGRPRTYDHPVMEVKDACGDGPAWSHLAIWHVFESTFASPVMPVQLVVGIDFQGVATGYQFGEGYPPSSFWMNWLGLFLGIEKPLSRGTVAGLEPWNDKQLRAFKQKREFCTETMTEEFWSPRSVFLSSEQQPGLSGGLIIPMQGCWGEWDVPVRQCVCLVACQLHCETYGGGGVRVDFARPPALRLGLRGIEVVC